MHFADEFNPTPDEIRRWAATEGAMYPSEDWDIIISTDPDLDELFFELASDPTCLKQRTFLHILYLIVGDAVRSSWNTRSREQTDALIERAARTTEPVVARWAEQSRDLVAHPNRFDYDAWCGGGLAREDL